MAYDQLGPIDGAIANAGLYSFGTTWELSEQQWDETVAVVLKGTWITRNVVIPHMLSRRRGKIICIGSAGSFKELPSLGHDVVAKHGMIGLVKTLAIELAPYNINVNAICPTTVDMGMINNQAFFEYFAGGPGPNANCEYVIACLNEMDLFREISIYYLPLLKIICYPLKGCGNIFCVAPLHCNQVFTNTKRLQIIGLLLSDVDIDMETGASRSQKNARVFT